MKHVLCAAVAATTAAFASLQPCRIEAQTSGPGVGGDVASVSYAQILAGLSDPTRWLTYSGDYSGRRHSPLTQITPQNVGRLVPIWTFQTGTDTRGRGFETTPLVVDGVLYVTGSNNFAWALDARYPPRAPARARAGAARLPSPAGPAARTR